jgi:hypothetical protein
MSNWTFVEKPGEVITNPYIFEKEEGMKTVRLRKSELLEKLGANRDKHKEIFLEALDGYKKAIIDALESRLADAKAGKRIDTYINLEQPIDQTKEYDRVITMLVMSLDDEIELDERQFAQYVMDDWSWKSQFLATNSVYSSTAATLSGAMED